MMVWNSRCPCLCLHSTGRRCSFVLSNACPPLCRGQGAVQNDRLADSGRCQLIRRIFASRAQPDQGLVPGVVGNAEASHVAGNQHPGFEIQGRERALLRHHVDIGPVFVVLAALQNGRIECAELPADFGKVRTIAGIAAVEEASVARCQGKAAPEALPLEKEAPGIVSGRQQVQGQRVESDPVAPVQLADKCRIETPGFERGATCA